jgi:hypothetical protein
LQTIVGTQLPIVCKNSAFGRNLYKFGPLPFCCICWHLESVERRLILVEGEHLLYSFLTAQPNGVAGPIHPKAMPVILTTPEEYDTWLSASTEEALKRQRPLPEEMLRIVAEGKKSDPPV